MQADGDDQPTMEDALMAKVLRELAATPYACVHLEPCSTRPGNYVFRGHLEKKLANNSGEIVESIIIKHTADSGSSGANSASKKQRQA